MRDKPCVCWVFVAPSADGWDQDFWLAFFPHLAIFEGGVDGFDPLEKSVYRAFEGSFSFIRAFPRGLIGRVQTAVQWAGNSRETGSLGPAPSARGGPRNSDRLLRWDPDHREGVWHATEETELPG